MNQNLKGKSSVELIEGKDAQVSYERAMFFALSEKITVIVTKKLSGGGQGRREIYRISPLGVVDEPLPEPLRVPMKALAADAFFKALQFTREKQKDHKLAGINRFGHYLNQIEAVAAAIAAGELQ